MADVLLVKGQGPNVRVRGSWRIGYRKSVIGYRTQRVDDVRQFPRTQQRVNFRNFPAKLLAVTFGEAAGDDETRALAVALLLRHLEDRVDRFLLGVVDERARIHDEDVG